MVMDGFILTTKSALDAWQNAIANNTAYSLECRMRHKKWCLFLVVGSSSARFR
jgi:hypothetical protein